MLISHSSAVVCLTVGKQCDSILIITPSVGVDIDECAQHNGGCSDHAVCSNTEGSFKCSCNDGFAGDGFTCNAGMSSPSELLTDVTNGHGCSLS